MSATTNDAISGTSADLTARNTVDPTDTPIPLWPEGVVAALAGITLLIIGLKHRTWLQRKGTEAQRAVQEFQKQGGLDELTQVAAHAAELLKGAKG